MALKDWRDMRLAREFRPGKAKTGLGLYEPHLNSGSTELPLSFPQIWIF
jgi:hypothetical protein